MNEPREVIRDNLLIQEDVQAWRRQMIWVLLRVAVVAAAVALVPGLIQIQYPWLIVVYLAAYGTLVLVTFWQRVPYAVQASTVLALVYALGVVALLEDGLSGDGRVFLLTLPFLAVLLFGWRQGVVALVLAGVTLAAFAWAFAADYLAIPEEMYIYSANPLAWLSGTLVFLMLGALVVASLGNLVFRLTATLRQSRGLAQDLAERDDLMRERSEKLQVAHALLARHTKALEVTAEVAQTASLTSSLPELLSRVVNLIGERLDFDHVGVFLLDVGGQWATLQAASSEEGQQMLARGHRVNVGEASDEGIGYVAKQGEPYVAKVGPASDTAGLSEAHAQVALPLRSQGGLIGILDVRSHKSEGLGQEDISVLQTLANQVAVAISNVQLFQQAQEGVNVQQRAYAALTREAWQELLLARASTGERYDPQGILPADKRWRQDMKQAAQRGEAVLGETGATSTLALPIRVRGGQVMGVLDAHKSAGAGAWTAAEIELMETLVERLGAALDSAQLYQQTQRLAAREQTIGQITAQFTRALDRETLLRTAVQELGKLPGVAEVSVHIGMPEAVAIASQMEKSHE